MKILSLLVLLIVFGAQAQHAPFIDFNRYFRTFYKNSFRQLEFQPIRSFEGSDTYTVYLDYRGDFKYYDGEKVQTISNQSITYKLSDGQLAWTIGTGLFCLSGDEKIMLTVFADRFEVTDSLIVYEDTRFNSLNYRYKGENHQLVQSTGDLQFPLKLGDNTIVYKDNGDFIKFLWRGTSYDYNVYTKAINFECGMDVICFNDPLNQSFAVFDKGQILDLESMFVKKYKAGRGFVAYEDQQGNLWYYKNGEKQQISNFPSFWEVKDDLLVWGENSIVYAFYEGEKKQLANYTPADYKIKNSTIAFRNSMGGVSVFSQGKLEQVTTQTQSSYEIYGNTVLVELFNKSFVVYSDGQKFEL
ncbi:MAG: hypothetical protein K0R65_1538 [Crocinitomicaceae bacterium]|jgi:hypothetical protein|nr:hypothetical protein [Crocinitomicaceae bacterium]